MGAESGFAREVEKDTQREKEHEEISQHSQHMDTDKDGKDSHAKTKHLKKPDDPEKQGSLTRDKVICGTAAPTDKSLDMRPWDLTLETDAESAARPSSPDPNLSERQGPQPREEQEGLHVEPVKAGGVLSGGTRLELVDPCHTPAEIDIQTLAGNR